VRDIFLSSCPAALLIHEVFFRLSFNTSLNHHFLFHDGDFVVCFFFFFFWFVGFFGLGAGGCFLVVFLFWRWGFFFFFFFLSSLPVPFYETLFLRKILAGTVPRPFPASRGPGSLFSGGKGVLLVRDDFPPSFSMRSVAPHSSSFHGFEKDETFSSLMMSNVLTFRISPLPLNPSETICALRVFVIISNLP